jgi:tight adherence protein B
VTPLPVMLVSMTAGVGVVVTLAGLSGRRLLDARRTRAVSVDGAAGRLLAGTAVGLVVLWWTRWPVAAASGAALAGWLPSMLAARGRHDRELDTVDGIATWTEQLRDTMSAANGLEHAIVATAPLAPRSLGPAVAKLAARVEYQQTQIGLRSFADEVDHPLADFVVAALVTTTQHQAREVAALLGHLADCARDEAAMRRRIWVGRARSRSSMRIIVGVLVVFIASLLLLDPSYLAPYSTSGGQLTLLLVVGLFGGSFVAMDRLGRLRVPDRFIARRGAMR